MGQRCSSDLGRSKGLVRKSLAAASGFCLGGHDIHTNAPKSSPLKEVFVCKSIPRSSQFLARQSLGVVLCRSLMSLPLRSQFCLLPKSPKKFLACKGLYSWGRPEKLKGIQRHRSVICPNAVACWIRCLTSAG